MSARRALEALAEEREFLELAAQYQDELDKAKAAVEAALESGGDRKIANAREKLEAAKERMREFRHWARSTGSPRELGPNDAVIRVEG